ncbi:MAG: AmmeMemoRadiSam system radical SAM enzyme [Candidatus Aenigmarchaeota archaeon]|nr:AmmeMemoRadiSam system radical SAM enzyme [Candidatus Aenigmarchaeota archaeon]
MKEAMFYKQIKNAIKCGLCARNCIIAENQVGFCRVRKNIKDKLYSLVYGKLCSVAVDPIEKKPLYMFAPGSRTVSISTVGCNFRCKFCCNYGISQEWTNVIGQDHTPEQLIDLAKKFGVQGFSYTYTEPTIFYEFSYDTAKIARKNGFYNMFVTNGYTSPEAIKEISKYLDAAVVDLKGSANPKFYNEFSSVPKVEPIFDALLAYKKNKIYIEITDLIVPKVGDNMEDVKKLCKWIFDNLGDKTPFHLIQFFPTHKLTDLPRTPIKTMEKAYEIAKKEGLKYVYLGNVHNHKLENTYCHNCGNLVIERTILGVKKFSLKKDFKCPKCGEEIPIFGKRWVPEHF